jgi:hypothetical protein
MFRRTLVVLAVLSLGTLAWAAAAGAQTTPSYPPNASVLGLTVTAGGPGTSVTVSGSACTPGATVTVTFDGQVIGTTTAGPTGAFTMTVTIPAGATPGVHTILASGAGCSESATFTVPAVAASGVAFTGANVGGLSAAGAGLALLGAVLVFATRRRRELTHSAQD